MRYASIWYDRILSAAHTSNPLLACWDRRWMDSSWATNTERFAACLDFNSIDLKKLQHFWKRARLTRDSRLQRSLLLQGPSDQLVASVFFDLEMLRLQLIQGRITNILHSLSCFDVEPQIFLVFAFLFQSHLQRSHLPGLCISKVLWIHTQSNLKTSHHAKIRKV